MRSMITAIVLCLPGAAAADWAKDIRELAATQSSAISVNWTTRRTLTIDVRDEEANHNDFASEYCLLFRNHGLLTQGTYRVRIRSAGTDRIFGEAVCY